MGMLVPIRRLATFLAVWLLEVPSIPVRQRQRRKYNGMTLYVVECRSRLICLHCGTLGVDGLHLIIDIFNFFEYITS